MATQQGDSVRLTQKRATMGIKIRDEHCLKNLGKKDINPGGKHCDRDINVKLVKHLNVITRTL